jgi:hypothetical protein
VGNTTSRHNVKSLVLFSGDIFDDIMTEKIDQRNAHGNWWEGILCALRKPLVNPLAKSFEINTW